MNWEFDGEQGRAWFLFLPPYSPDFNPIENAFTKLRALLRKAAERTVDGLWDAIGHIIELFTPQQCANYFATAGYDPDQGESALGGPLSPTFQTCCCCTRNGSYVPRVVIRGLPPERSFGPPQKTST